MKYNPITRRHFLQGAGGSFLALPFLPSLMSKADAATTVANYPKFLVMFWNGHGGIEQQNLYPITSNPAVSGQMTTNMLYPAQGHSYQIGNLSSLLTTRNSNLPYLSTYLGNQIEGMGLSNNPLAPTPTAYSLDPSGNDFDNGAARVSPVIGSFVSNGLLNKMTLLSGIDFMFSSGHNCAATGNFCNYSGNAPSGNANTNPTMTNSWVPTIDQVAAAYPPFYGNSVPLAKAVSLNTLYGCVEDMSLYISALNSSTGIEFNPNSPQNMGQAFQLLFGGLIADQNNPNAGKKNFILNKIHDDYVRVARGAYGPGRRIGKEDRSIFEEFISNVESIITGVTAYGVCTIPQGISTNSTAVVQANSGDPNTASYLSLYNQMIVAAFSCGLTQCFTVGVPGLTDIFNPAGSANPSFTTGVTGPDTHQTIYHQHNDDSRQTLMVKAKRYFFQNCFYNLMQQLDAVSSPSGNGTLLDQSLLYWTAECGFITHNGFSLPTIMAGSAGGFIKTGKFADYRASNRLLNDPTYGSLLSYQGLPQNRLLGTILQAMGVPPSAYELSPSLFTGSAGRIPVSSLGTVPGYGHTSQLSLGLNGAAAQYVYDYQLNDMSVPMPGIT